MQVDSNKHTAFQHIGTKKQPMQIELQVQNALDTKPRVVKTEPWQQKKVKISVIMRGVAALTHLISWLLFPENLSQRFLFVCARS